IYVFRNSGRDGTWFLDPVTVAKSGSSQCTSAVRIADVDGDGRPDIVAASACGGSAVDVYHNSGVIADFRTLAPTSYATNVANADLALADLYGSGQSDVIVGGSDTSGAGAVVKLSSYSPAPAPTPPPTVTPPPTEPGPTPSAPAPSASSSSPQSQ